MRLRSVPQSVFKLGTLGLLPFLCLCTVAFVTSTQAPQIALAAYGVAILSFLGVAHWGSLFSVGTIVAERTFSPLHVFVRHGHPDIASRHRFHCRVGC